QHNGQAEPHDDHSADSALLAGHRGSIIHSPTKIFTAGVSDLPHSTPKTCLHEPLPAGLYSTRRSARSWRGCPTVPHFHIFVTPCSLPPFPAAVLALAPASPVPPS